ncbi:MAG: hypothetical protein KIS75_10695 [Chromatiales bacterium]|nr:hypothetical protein [Chromatiales bacterium]
MKGMQKPRGKYGTGMLDDAAKKINTKKQTQAERMNSVMSDIQATRGQRRRDSQNGK